MRMEPDRASIVESQTKESCLCGYTEKTDSPKVSLSQPEALKKVRQPCLCGYDEEKEARFKKAKQEAKEAQARVAASAGEHKEETKVPLKRDFLGLGKFTEQEIVALEGLNK